MNNNFFVEYDKEGYWLTLINPRGKKAPVYICQTDKPGFTAKYLNSCRYITHNKSAEVLAKKLIQEGHKEVKMLD